MSAKLTSNDVKYMKMAEKYALLSDCNKRRVGAIGVSDSYIKTGFNLHQHLCDCKPKSNTVVHAEMFCIDKRVNTIYVTYQPCLDCAKAIVKRSAVKRVYYRDAKPSDMRGVEYLQKYGIEVFNLWYV